MINQENRITKREVSLMRAEELRSEIAQYIQIEPTIQTGIRMHQRTENNRQQLLEFFQATEKDWKSWGWQMKHRISNPDILSHFLPFNEFEMQALRKISEKVRWAVSPYYLSLIDFNNYYESPVYKQAVPSILELRDKSGTVDPMGEETTNPAPLITRRYPDRLIINVTNQCGMYCRHCQRRRNFGEIDYHAARSDMEAAVQYIRENPEIRDVLITGGDALMLSDKTIDWLLGELDAIEHVEIKRLGTRVPVTLPQRITSALCAVLKKHPPIYINTQFNVPEEVTPEAKEACDHLIEAGVVLGNQAVLLKGINDNVHIMKKLNQELLKIRVRPYYIFHAKQVRGTSHFISSVEKGLEIMENLRGFTSGLAVPTYIINAPDGYGKTPVNPRYVLNLTDDEVIFRTWQGRQFNYPNHSEG
ncbi:MAG: glutamate 2,3-aminomutase [Bacillota bacterium]|nr:glutamate 2,3-aminomutase [Bacillota bacterium]